VVEITGQPAAPSVIMAAELTMNRAVLSVGLAALLSLPVAGQSTPPAARFQVADVHPSPPTQIPATPVMRVVGPQNGKYELRRGTMVDLIRTAYGVEADKVVGGPHWLEMDRFDVIAKVPPSTTRDAVKPMLQALLVERFGLAARQDIKPVPGHVLTRGTGELKLKEATGGVATTCPQNVQSTTNSLQLTMTCRGLSMAALVEQFTRTSSLIGVTGPDSSVYAIRRQPSRVATRLAAGRRHRFGRPSGDRPDREASSRLIFQPAPLLSGASDSMRATPLLLLGHIARPFPTISVFCQ